VQRSQTICPSSFRSFASIAQHLWIVRTEAPEPHTRRL
jgi:hypothetical protein